MKLKFIEILTILGINQAEAARLLSVNSRTVRRWVENPDEIPGPAEQTFIAWLKLHQLGLSWRPNEIDLGLKDDEILKIVFNERKKLFKIDSILKKIEENGGVFVPWQVDLKKRVATLGTIKLYFCMLGNDFIPTSYSRTDLLPCLKRDRNLLDHAFACISLAIKGG